MTDENEDRSKFDAGALVPPGWLEEHPGVIPTAVISAIEAIDGDGNTGFYRIVSDACPEWKALGLLRAATMQTEYDWNQAIAVDPDD